MRVLITGATGFLGWHLVTQLGAAGHSLVAFARETSNTQTIEQMGVRIVRGAFDDADSVRVALQGIDAVVHAAGGGIVRHVSDYYRGNTASTQALVDNLPKSVKHFVLISSLAAHGPCRRRPATEDEADRPRSHYGKSKLEAERIVLGHPQIHATILRPPALYGGGEHRMVALFRLARLGFVPTVRPFGTVSLLSGRDCARAVASALETDHASGHCYVAEPEPISRIRMAQAIAETAGHQRVVPLPASWVQGAGAIGEWYGQKKRKASMLNRDKARDLIAPHQSCNPSRAQRLLGWVAEDRFVTSTRSIARAYRLRGWLH